MADIANCRVDLNHGRAVLDCRPGMTLFAALRTHKLYLPTGCGARGLCGQCKIKLLSGEANPHTDSELRLVSDEERAAGFRLGCQLRLSGDLAAEVPEQVFFAKPYPVTVDSITPLTHDIRRFGLVPDDGARIPHRAGQFINLVAKIPSAKAQVIRCFSFATPSSVEDRVDIIVRLNPHGVMTPHLFNEVKAGDKLSLIAPFGTFHLQDSKKPCVWIAGGSGLSPFLGMLQDLIEQGNGDRTVHLFFGAVKPGDLYYVDLLGQIAKEHPWFQFTPALSGNEHSDVCMEYGLITDVVTRRVADASDCEGYLCGSPGMLQACIKVLTEKGAKRENIFYDRF